MTTTFTVPGKSIDITDAEAFRRALVELTTFFNAGIFDTKHVDVVNDASPSVGPEMDFKGNRGRWFVGIDVANADTSRDFVLAGIRLDYVFSDGATTNGSPTLTSAAHGGFSSLLVGAVITGAGIPAGTTVQAVGSATSLTMSANATATASGVSVTLTTGLVSDIVYLKHRGSLSPTVGIGVTPPDGGHRLQVSPSDSEVGMGTLDLRRGPSQTGNVLTIHDSTPTNRLVVDKDFYLQGNHPTTSGGVVIAADATNQHALELTDSTKTNFYAFDLPTGSGGVLRLRCQSGGQSCLDVGTNGSLRHLSTQLGFYGASVTAKPTVTGSRGGNAALASLLTALATLGLITDSSSA